MVSGTLCALLGCAVLACRVHLLLLRGAFNAWNLVVGMSLALDTRPRTKPLSDGKA